MKFIIKLKSTNQIIEEYTIDSCKAIWYLDSKCYFELSLDKTKIKITKHEDDLMTLYKSNYQYGGYETLQLAINQGIIYLLSCSSSKPFNANLIRGNTPLAYNPASHKDPMLHNIPHNL